MNIFLVIKPVRKWKNTPYLLRVVRHREVKANLHFSRPGGIETLAILMPVKTDLRSCSRCQFDLRSIQRLYLRVHETREECLKGAGISEWKVSSTFKREKNEELETEAEIRDIRKVDQRLTFREVDRGSGRNLSPMLNATSLLIYCYEPQLDDDYYHTLHI